MSIFTNLFNPAPAPAPQTTPAVDPNAAPVVPQAGNLQDPNVVAQQGAVPQTPGTPPAQDPSIPNKEDTPLAEFSSLWDTPDNTDTNVPTQPAPLNAEELRSVVAKQDFTGMIPAETLAGIPEEQHAAFTSAMNSVAQNVMTQATLVNNKLNAQNLKAAEDRFAAQLPQLLRAQAVTNHAKETNPLLDNPAIKPVADATRAQLLAKFPDASQSKITEMTENFITQMGQAINPTEPEPQLDTEQDFSSFLEKGTVG